MQAKQLIGLMKGEIACNEDTLPEIRNLVEEYPYFQAAQLLYTLNLRANKDSRFEAELRKTACYMSDRKCLLFRIESDFFTPERMEKPDKEEDAIPESSFDRIDSFLLESTHPETLPTDYLPYLLSDTPGKTTSETVPLQHQATIDKFLEENEKAPVKIVLNPEAEPADESALPSWDSVDSESFFSETLAKIYLKQKKYEKALAIIRKLDLIYPEKNRYFADQIRYLEKLISNTKK
jgi:tetratricopeptide (TPR) repeat protein